MGKMAIWHKIDASHWSLSGAHGGEHSIQLVSRPLTSCATTRCTSSGANEAA